jgi:ParB/RepB/Spo0J family partition protein
MVDGVRMKRRSAIPPKLLSVSQTRVAITKVKIGKRHRRDLGDIDTLARSVADIGLLHPIVVRPDGRLIAGERRLQACKKLGWADVPIRVVDIDKIVRGEFAENAHRKDFLPSEIDAIRQAIEPIQRAAARERMTLGKISPGSGRTRDKVAAFAGVSGRQLEKIRAVIEAAERDPETFAHLVKVLDSPHGVTKAHYALRRAQDQQRISTLVPQPGKYRTLIVDPSWPQDQVYGRWGPTYARMGRDEILALPVAAWAEEDCHLYLWTPNANLPLAVECMAHWGFKHCSVLTWVKPGLGLGNYFRGTTEHVLFGIRGKLGLRSTSIATHFEAEVGDHSEKPDKLYDIVKRASYPPYGEAFQRKAREGFVNLFEPENRARAA